MANRLRAWGPAAGWAAVLFVLSALPDISGPARIPYADKLGHMGLYAVLGGLLAWGRAKAGRPLGHVSLLMIGALYGLSDEWHQMYVPGRSPDVADWVADVVGLLVGYTLVTLRWGPRNDR